MTAANLCREAVNFTIRYDGYGQRWIQCRCSKRTGDVPTLFLMVALIIVLYSTVVRYNQVNVTQIYLYNQKYKNYVAKLYEKQD